MTKASYLQRGEALDYTNSTSKMIPAGAIISIGDHIGVAGTDIPPGKVGSIHVVGVFEINKSDASEVIEQGKTLYFDGTGITASSGEATTAETADADGTGESDTAETADVAAIIVAGYAAAPSTAEDTTVLVKLCG